MNLDELIEHQRWEVLRDQAQPPLWSDELLTRHFNEAEVQFARRTHILSDERSDFTFITTEPGVQLYDLDPRIVFVADVLFMDTGIRLRDTSRNRLPGRFVTGRPTAYALDAAMRSIRLSPTPDAAYELDLLVARNPLARLSAGSDVPEIPEEYHIALCDWVAYRCLRNNDPEKTGMVEAKAFQEQWEHAVRDAKRDIYRMRSGPRPTAIGRRRTL